MTDVSSPVGLIGLGLMGTALVERLSRHAFAVLGFDINPRRMAALSQLKGFQAAADAGMVLERCERVLLSLPTHREVSGLFASHESALRAGQVILDTTTGDPANSIRIASESMSHGVTYCDATISGNSEQLRAGDVLWMVGGDVEAVARCGDLLRALGRETIHTGPAGTGARMKLVTNLVLGLNRAALAEGLAFAEGIGISAAVALKVLMASAAYSRIMDVKGVKMVNREYDPQARLSQHLKDVRLIRAAGDAANLDLPLSAAHQEILERAERLGFGEQDNSALIEVLRRARK
jgi:3-hydroxyisobutyrate dehydrogenase-like beta-hydroxyacid dehydrogenase